MTSSATSSAEPAEKKQKLNKLPTQFISTWNNYTEADIDHFRAWCEKRTQYSLVAREVGKVELTPHLQGYHQTSGGLSFDAFKKQFPSVDVTPVYIDNGASSYPEKDGDICIQTGEFVQKQQGKRTDLATVAELARSGQTLAQIAETAPQVVLQYPAGLARLCSLYEKPRDRSTPKVCICLFGPTGTGKTKRIYDYLETIGEKPYVWDNAMPTWWEGYSGERHVIMDEFRGCLPMKYLLRLTDRYPMRVQYKGGSCQFMADYMYFTSSKQPSEWYDDAFNDRVQQLLRRFDRILHVTSLDQVVDLQMH